MTECTELGFKIGIVGPTRVGKTSLIASILADGQRLLEGTKLKLHPRGTATERRLAQHYNELEGSLRAGQFNSGAVHGTEEQFTFELHLDAGVPSAGIHLDFLDFPGGWLDASQRPREREKEWEACKRWIADSTVVLVPIESAVLMEAAAAKHKIATPEILTRHQVGQVAREWAKKRTDHPEEPGLLILCPVKCESYFKDNGGHHDFSAELFRAVRDMYQDILQAVRREAPHVKIVYAPVDTIGCVEIIRGSWREDAKAPGGFEFNAEYRVRPPGHHAVKAADEVLVAICKHLVEATRKAKHAKANWKKDDATAAHDRATADEGLLGNIWRWISGTQARLDKEADNLKNEADRQRQCVEQLDKVIADLAGRKFGPRVREI